MKRFLLIGVAILMAVTIVPAAAFTQIQQPMSIQIDVEELGSASPTLNIVDNTGTTDAAELGWISGGGKGGCDVYRMDMSKVPLAIARKQVMVIGGPKSGYDASEQDNYLCQDLSRTTGPYAGVTFDWNTIDYVFMIQNNHPDQDLKLWIIMSDTWAPMGPSYLPPRGMEIEIWAVQGNASLPHPFRLFKIDHSGVYASWSSADTLVCSLCSPDEDQTGYGYGKVGHTATNDELKCWIVVKTDGCCCIDDYHAHWRLIANTFD